MQFYLIALNNKLTKIFLCLPNILGWANQDIKSLIKLI